MQYHFFINTIERLPATFSRELSEPVEDRTLAGIVFNGNPQLILPRETFSHAFSYQLNGLCLQGKRKADFSALVVDQKAHSENWNRFDHYQELWTTILHVKDGHWTYIVLRDGEDDYDTWTQLYYGDDACSDDLRTTQTIELETCHTDPQSVLQSLSIIHSVDDLRVIALR